ncbi:MAG TPA: hypothetical protein VF876_02085 [Burkholderiales bacterium]
MTRTGKQLVAETIAIAGIAVAVLSFREDIVAQCKPRVDVERSWMPR